MSSSLTTLLARCFLPLWPNNLRGQGITFLGATQGMPIAKIGDLGLATRNTDSADIKGFAGTVHPDYSSSCAHTGSTSNIFCVRTILSFFSLDTLLR